MSKTTHNKKVLAMVPVLVLRMRICIWICVHISVRIRIPNLRCRSCCWSALLRIRLLMVCLRVVAPAGLALRMVPNHRGSDRFLVFIVRGAKPMKIGPCLLQLLCFVVVCLYVLLLDCCLEPGLCSVWLQTL